jgi:ribulose-5-phosphate 4-epimerase/fuculose-1-phosphate aldolase
VLSPPHDLHRDRIATPIFWPEDPCVEKTDAPCTFSWSASTTVDAERLHRKQRLAMALRIFAHFHLDEGFAGHITVRDPGERDRFWVNPFAVPFERVRVSDLLLVDRQGQVVEGERSVNPSAFAIHASIHAARPEVDAAAHSHSRFGKAWSTLGRRVSPITQDHCDFYDDHALYDDYRGRVLEPTEGDDITNALGQTKALILRNHGLLTVGQSVEEATWWFLRLERCCEIQLLAEAAGTPLLIDDHAARDAHREQGTPLAGWFTAQPLFEAIVADQPGLLD